MSNPADALTHWHPSPGESLGYTFSMLSSRHKFVFIHIPKTAGTSLTAVLEPLSDDRSTAGGSGPLSDAQDLVGPITRTKHMRLREYQARLGQDLNDYLLLTSVRHPVERMLSFYFWEHHWLKGRFPGGRRIARSTRSLRLARAVTVEEEPYWDRENFYAQVASLETQSDYLRGVDGTVQSPDWSFVADDPERSTAELADLLSISHLPTVARANVGRYRHLTRELASDKSICDYVFNAHLEDYLNFNFQRYPA